MKTFSQFAKLNEAEDEGALKYVKQMKDPSDGKEKWALYSIHSGKALKYFDHKPSKEEADKALRTVEFFKHNG